VHLFNAAKPPGFGTPEALRVDSLTLLDRIYLFPGISVPQGAD
jgi:hypothetical protein